MCVCVLMCVCVCVCVCVCIKIYILISLSMDDNIYAPPWGLSTLVNEFSPAARIIQSFSKELSTLVTDRV